MATLTEIPDMQAMPVLAAQQQLRIQTVLHQVRCAPFAGDSDVVTQVPCEVVAEVLRTAIDLPSARRLEIVVIQGKDSARTVAAGRAKGA